MSYLRYLCLFVYSGVQHILCCGFCFACLRFVYPMLPISLNCTFCLPLRCSLMFMYSSSHKEVSLFAQRESKLKSKRDANRRLVFWRLQYSCMIHVSETSNSLTMVVEGVLHITIIKHTTHRPISCGYQVIGPF